MTEIDLCIVSYNAKEKIERLLCTIYELNDNSLFNIYIVDNDSTDGSKELLTTMNKYLDYTLVHKPNVGYAAACNYAASLGAAPIIGLLNCDLWFGEGDIAKLIKSFQDHPDAAVIGPKQRDEYGRITHAGIIGTNEQPKHRAWHESDSHDSMYRDYIECVTVSGSAYFVRRSVWEEVIQNEQYLALYNECAQESAAILGVDPSEWTNTPGAFLSTPFYYEETFASYYIRHLGYKICYDGSISIGHSWHGSHERGSKMEGMFRVSQTMFRKGCDMFGIRRD